MTKHNSFENSKDWNAIEHDLINVDIVFKRFGQDECGTVVAAYENVKYKGTRDAHIVLYIKHRPIWWGGSIYTEHALFFHEDGRGPSIVLKN